MREACSLLHLGLPSIPQVQLESLCGQSQENSQLGTRLVSQSRDTLSHTGVKSNSLTHAGLRGASGNAFLTSLFSPLGPREFDPQTFQSFSRCHKPQLYPILKDIQVTNPVHWPQLAWAVCQGGWEVHGEAAASTPERLCEQRSFLACSPSSCTKDLQAQPCAGLQSQQEEAHVK